MVNEGDLVILKSDRSPRAFWKVAKVEQIIPSRVNIIRAARVRVINETSGKPSCLRRPIQPLIPLELHSIWQGDNDEENRPERDVQEGSTSEVRPKRKAAMNRDAARKDILKHC